MRGTLATSSYAIAAHDSAVSVSLDTQLCRFSERRDCGSENRLFFIYVNQISFCVKKSESSGTLQLSCYISLEILMIQSVLSVILCS